MVRRVISQVSRRDIVDVVNRVVARDEMRVGALASVMNVRRIHGSEERNQHRQNEDEHARKWTPKGQTRHERHDEKRRKKQRPLMRGIFVPNPPRSWIRLHRVPHRVFEPAHRAAIVILPARFVFALVQVIHVMPKRMVQHPCIGRDPGLKRIHLLEHAIEPCRFERRDMLMMMVERANAALWKDTHDRPSDQCPHIVDECIHHEIAAEEQGKAKHGKSVLPISKDTHERLADQVYKEGTYRADVRTAATIAAFSRGQ